MNHLQSGSLKLGLLRNQARRDLIECLLRIEGGKTVVWDNSLPGPIGLVAEYSLLQERGITKMYPLVAGPLPAITSPNVVFISRANLSNMDNIADNLQGAKPDVEFHLVFLPRRSLICEKRLEDLGVVNKLKVHEFPLDILPIDTDLLSMEINDSFKRLFVDADYSILHSVAKAIETIQGLYGVIPVVYGKGELSQRVAAMVERMSADLTSPIAPDIDNLVLIDRSTDLVTPLATQLTYEGLIDELYGLHCTTVTLPPEKFLTKQEKDRIRPDETPPNKKLILNDSDEMFGELRDKNFHAVGPSLSAKAKGLTSQVEESKSARSIGEYKQFVSKLPHIQAAKAALAMHTSVTELLKEKVDSVEFLEGLRCQQEFINGIELDRVNEFVDDCIGRGDPLVKVLRLMCVQSCCGNGLKPKVLEAYRSGVVQGYGYRHQLALERLETAGLLVEQQSSKTFAYLRRYLKLNVEDINEQNPADISYVFSGYAPLSCRLLQVLFPEGAPPAEEVLRHIPGPTVHCKQTLPKGVQPSDGPVSKTLVFFIGGVTYAEIAALRFLSQRGKSTEFIVAATNITNGNNLISRLI